MKIVKQGSMIRFAILTALVLTFVLTAGCKKNGPEPTDSIKNNIHSAIPENTEAQTETETTAPDLTEPDVTEPGDEGASLVSLRQAMVETPQLFAVAYFGYHETFDSDDPVDPYAAMLKVAPKLCDDLPFLLDIPEDRIVGEAGDLFCIVPLNEDATVAVSTSMWDDINEEFIYEESIYYSESGEPILLFCNSSGWEPDTQLYISGPSGDVIWYPQQDDNHCAAPLMNDDWEEMFYDFSPYREMLEMEYRSMKENPDWGYQLPTEDDLIDKTWTWYGYRKDGLDISYLVTFSNGYLTVRWYDGIDRIEHSYHNAEWELTHQDGYAVLTIDFQEFAGILRYDLLYSPSYGDLYVAMDILQADMPIGWEPLYRHLSQPYSHDPMDMAGTWELVWTEFEGYQEEAEPGTATIEITTDYEGNYWISFADNTSPDENFTGKELTVIYDELFYGCGNDEWMASVNHTGKYGTEYNLALLFNDTLLLQRYFELDGAPSVSYGCYRRTYG